MNDTKEKIDRYGLAIIADVYSDEEVDAIASVIVKANGNSAAFRKTADLFAIRQVLKEVPTLAEIVFTPHLKSLIARLFGDGYAVVKSVYFDKPEGSNWFVSYHQDLTISVKEKVEAIGFENWTKKGDGFAVQPPVSMLQDNFTVRIHLDDTTVHNGALKVVPGSHLSGIQRPETINRNEEMICEVPKGGVMIMKPLLFHSSSRTTDKNRRRVVHLEFSRQPLPNSLQWAEFWRL